MTLTPLAQNNFGDNVPGGLAGPMGLLIIVLLGIATVSYTHLTLPTILLV